MRGSEIHNLFTSAQILKRNIYFLLHVILYLVIIYNYNITGIEEAIPRGINISIKIH